MEQKEISRQEISRVLISVSDKSGIEALSKDLSKKGIEIISTGGTSRVISEAGVIVRPVEEVTNFPEMMGGRVKTLHPLIFGAILGRESDQEQMLEHNIDRIDMVICNLYPFKDAADKGVDLDFLIEEIFFPPLIKGQVIVAFTVSCSSSSTVAFKSLFSVFE